MGTLSAASTIWTALHGKPVGPGERPRRRFRKKKNKKNLEKKTTQKREDGQMSRVIDSQFPVPAATTREELVEMLLQREIEVEYDRLLRDLCSSASPSSRSSSASHFHSSSRATICRMETNAKLAKQTISELKLRVQQLSATVKQTEQECTSRMTKMEQKIHTYQMRNRKRHQMTRLALTDAVRVVDDVESQVQQHRNVKEDDEEEEENDDAFAEMENVRMQHDEEEEGEEEQKKQNKRTGGGKRRTTAKKRRLLSKRMNRIPAVFAESSPPSSPEVGSEATSFAAGIPRLNGDSRRANTSLFARLMSNQGGMKLTIPKLKPA